MSNKWNIQGIELLRFNHAGAMQLKDGSTINYGVIRIDDNEVVYYTGKGLREIWKPQMTAEEIIRAENLKRMVNLGGERELIESGYIAITPLSDIERVIF